MRRARGRGRPGVVRGARWPTGGQLWPRAVVVTTGTFLQALMHVGERGQVGGRLGDAAATGLSDSLRALGFELGRFKTGTPARLLARLHRLGRGAPAAGRRRAPAVLAAHAARALPAAGRSSTAPSPTPTPRRTRVLRDNLHASPLFAGAHRRPRARATARRWRTRWCASPTGSGTPSSSSPRAPHSPLVYPAGLSTSLPAEVQLAFLRTIPGLEDGRGGPLRLRGGVRLRAADPARCRRSRPRVSRASSSPGSSTAPRATRRPRSRACWPGVNAALRLRGEAALVLGRARGARRGAGRRAGHPRGRRAVPHVDQPLRAPAGAARGQRGVPPAVPRSSRRPGVRHRGRHLRRACPPCGRRARIGSSAGRSSPAPAAGGDVPVTRTRRSSRPPLSPELCDEVETEAKYAGYIKQANAAWTRRADDHDGWVIPRELGGAPFRPVPRSQREARSPAPFHRRPGPPRARGHPRCGQPAPGPPPATE